MKQQMPLLFSPAAVICLAGLLSWSGNGTTAKSIGVDDLDGNVKLTCPVSDNINWKKGEENKGTDKTLFAGSVTEEDQINGFYECTDSENIYLFYRKCENCVEMDASTVSGIVIADVVATLLIAVAVYCISGQDKGKTSRASDKQNLIAHDQLYQPLRDRVEDSYSHIGVRRHKN